MHAGTELKLGGQTYVVPPLTLKQIQLLEPEITALGSGTIAEQAPRIVKIVHSALSRNYPELTAEQVADMLDLVNMSETVNAVMGVSGLKKAEESQANPTGADSTPTS